MGIGVVGGMFALTRSVARLRTWRWRPPTEGADPPRSEAMDDSQAFQLGDRVEMAV